MEILDGIGSTEVLHIFISNVKGQVVPGSTGRVVPGYQARLADENGELVPQGEIGNLMISGDSTCSAYWNKHERTKATIQGNWIQTGDKFYQDAEGNFWYCGRSDDMLKVSGQWVSPVEVESALSSHPSVLEAAVVAREDNEKLIKPQAYVVLKPGSAAQRGAGEELKQYVKMTLEPQKYPRWIVLWRAAQDGYGEDAALRAARATGGDRGRLRWRLTSPSAPLPRGEGSQRRA